MKKFTYTILLALLALSAVIGLSITNTYVLKNNPENLEVTVYNSNLGVVKELRTQYLNAGTNHLLYEGVASNIDPTSVKIKSINGNVEIIEQNYRYDLISKGKILQRYIGKNITAYQTYGDKKEIVEGTLLSHSNNQLVLKTREGIKLFSSDDLDLQELPEGLITVPTLDWQIYTEEEKTHNLEMSYMTSGMSWKADYVATMNKDDTKLDFNGWVTIANNAGTTFKNTSLKLVAGDVNRVSSPERYLDEIHYEAEKSGSGGSFEEESLFEYHMYTLQRRTTLNNNEQKQISFINSENINVEKEFVYENNRWYGSNNKINVMLNFDNTKTNNLGMPLPKGTIKIFKKDSEEKLQFIGEDSIDHTPKDETLRLLVGQAFDIVGERIQMDYNKLPGWYEYKWKVTLKNHKDENIVVTVLENTGGDWEIISENYPHTKESNYKIKWKIPVTANSESNLEYTIRYKRW